MKSMKVRITDSGAVQYWLDVRKGAHGVALLEDLLTRHRHIARRGDVPDPLVDQIDRTLREWMGVVETICRVTPKRIYYPELWIYFNDVDPADYGTHKRSLWDFVIVSLAIRNPYVKGDVLIIRSERNTEEEVATHRFPQTMLLNALLRMNNYIDWYLEDIVFEIRNWTNSRATSTVDIRIPRISRFEWLRDLDRDILNHNCMIDMGNRLVLKPEPWDYVDPFDMKELKRDTEKLIKEIQQDQETERTNGEA